MTKKNYDCPYLRVVSSRLRETLLTGSGGGASEGGKEEETNDKGVNIQFNKGQITKEFD